MIFMIVKILIIKNMSMVIILISESQYLVFLNDWIDSVLIVKIKMSVIRLKIYFGMDGNQNCMIIVVVLILIVNVIVQLNQ